MDRHRDIERTPTPHQKDFTKDVQGRWLKTAVEALNTFLRNEQSAIPVLDDAQRTLVRQHRSYLHGLSKMLLTEVAVESDVAEALEWWADQDAEEYDSHIVTLMALVREAQADDG